MIPDIILIGGGGHCKSVIEVIESAGQYKIGGIVDVPEKVGELVLGYKIIGSDNDLPSLMAEFRNFHITVGHIRSNKVRVKMFDQLREKGASLPVIIASTAHVSSHARVNEGSVIMHHAFVNAGAKIGKNCIINTGA